MFKNRLFILIVALTVVFSFAGLKNLWAVEQLQERGSVSVFGDYTSTSTDQANSQDVNIGQVGISAGYFFTDSIEIQAGIVGVFADYGSDTANNYNILGKLNYNFFSKGSTTVPYIGIQAGVNVTESGGSSDSAFSYGGQAGAKFFMSENTSFNIEARYIHYEMSVGNEDIGTNQLGLGVGLSYYF